MKKVSLSVLVIATVILFSCDDHSGESVRLLELTVDAGVYNSPDESWVFATNDQGDIVSWSPYAPGSRITLEAPKDEISDHITVTLIAHYASGYTKPLHEYNISSYMEVPLGLTFRQEAITPVSLVGVGKVNLDVVNLPPQGTFHVSLSSFDGHGGFGGANGNYYFNILKDPSDIFMSVILANGNPRYARVENATDNMTYHLDYATDFAEFDQNIPFQHSFSGNSVVMVHGFSIPIEEATPSLVHVQEQDYFSGRGDVTLGYNEGYKFYRTLWYGYPDDGRRTNYYKAGDPPTPESFKVPEYTFAVTNEKLNQFDFNATGNYAWNVSAWTKTVETPQEKNTINWKVSRPMTQRGVVINEFPGELFDKQPALESALEDLSYKSTTLMYNYSANAYHEYLTIVGSDGSPRSPKEWFSVTIPKQ